MCEIRPDDDGAAGGVVADFDQLFAFGGFEKDERGAARAGFAIDFGEAEHVAVEGDCLFQIGDAIAGVQEFFDHRMVCYIAAPTMCDNGNLRYYFGHASCAAMRVSARTSRVFPGSMRCHVLAPLGCGSGMTSKV